MARPHPRWRSRSAAGGVRRGAGSTGSGAGPRHGQGKQGQEDSPGGPGADRRCHRGHSVIFLWGLPGDEPTALVRAALERRGCECWFLDQRATMSTTLELEVDGAVRGVVREGGRALALEWVTAAYLRPHDSRRIPSVRRAGEAGVGHAL